MIDRKQAKELSPEDQELQRKMEERRKKNFDPDYSGYELYYRLLDSKLFTKLLKEISPKLDECRDIVSVN